MKKSFLLISLLLFISIIFGLNYVRHSIEHNQVITETLSNGLEVLIIPTHSPLVSIQLWVRTGAINETAQNNGISHYLEHMLFKNKQIVKALEAQGGAMNGATSDDFTYYYVTLPATNLTLPIRNLCDMVFTAGFTPSDAAQEKNIILEEISRGNDDPDQHIYNILNEKAYGTHPYARKVIGTEQSVKPLTYSQLREYYGTWYVPNNATLVIAGNITREAALKAARVASSYTPQATPVQQQRAVIDFTPNYAAYTINNLTTPRYSIIYSVPGYGSADTYTLDVLTYILANRTTALLTARLKEELDLVYNISCDYQTRKDRSLFIIDCQIKKPYELSRIRQEIEGIVQKITATEEDVRLAKMRLIADHYLAQESAEQVATAYGYYNTIGEYTYEQNYVQKIKAIELKDIQKMMPRYFKDSMQFVSYEVNNEKDFNGELPFLNHGIWITQKRHGYLQA